MKAAETVLNQSLCNQLSHEIRNFHINFNEAQLKVTGKLLDTSLLLYSLLSPQSQG